MSWKDATRTSRRGPLQARLSRTYDPEALRADVARFAPSDWIERAPGSGWKVVTFRSRGGDPRDVSAGDGRHHTAPFADTPNLARAPYVWSILCGFQTSLKSVRFSGLWPGATIAPHADHEVRLERGAPVRLHVPITRGDSDLRVEGEEMRWAPGELWYADFARVHSATNFGDEPRVHLLVVAVVNDWLLSLFPGAP